MATQPAWSPPPAPSPEVEANLPKLQIYNSLTRSKTPFIPLDKKGKKVSWYACGPTVYDDAHLGHARNYVSQDIIRRIMSDYFHFDLTFVMNITDVDDKIILAARQRFLLEQTMAHRTQVDEELRDIAYNSLVAYAEKNLSSLTIPAQKELSLDQWSEMVRREYQTVLDGPGSDAVAKLKMHITSARSTLAALTADYRMSVEDFVKKAEGTMMPYIDSRQSTEVKGSDHHIFTKHTKKYEQRFFDDMTTLNVRYPDKLTRVTEYGPQIVDFVKQIQGHGFAYENEGSIYYDTTAWEASGGHYARLEPWNRNDTALQADGEGSLSNKKTSFKKSNADFVLWKASKAGEPSWASPWGEGRPGWHIECSAMASDVLGKEIDIHSGGIDLAFPHHDNELAQSEAYWHSHGADSKQWVNYFLHMGHLSIQGSKMSKSLKNFITIKDAIAKGDWTARSLRIVFLLGGWKDGLEITPDMVKESRSWEERFDNFFIKVKDVQEQLKKAQSNGTNGGVEKHELDSALEASKAEFHEAMLDSFNTMKALRVLSDLVSKYNIQTRIPTGTSIAIGNWVTSMVVMFGLDAQYKTGQMGWSGLDIPEKAKAFIHPVAELRDLVREQAIQGKIDISALGRLDEKDNFYDATTQPYAKVYADFQRKIFELHSKNAPNKDYLAASDHLRDSALWDLGIYLEDRDGPSLVRPLSQALRDERKDKEAKAAEKAAAKDKAKAEAAAKEKERLEKGKLAPVDMFKTPEYSEWDADGLPTKDKEGKDVAKAQTKKLKKQWDAQKKLHDAYKSQVQT